MDVHRVSIDEALRSLQTTAAGLSPEEARRRLAEFGPNEVETIRSEPAIIRFLRELTHFFAVILWIAVAHCAHSSPTRCR